MPKILFNITHGFQARMLLRSAIADELLRAGTELVVCSPNSGETYFREEFDHPQITLEEMPSRFSRIERQAINLRQYLLMNPALGATLNYKRERFQRSSPKLFFLARLANSILGRVSLLRKAYMAIEASIYRGHEFDELLARHKPDLIVTGTPGVNPFDIHLLRAAKRHKLRTATVMLSWDNLTSKGYMNGVPDRLLVWSDLMAREAVEYHDYPVQHIQWTGAAQFDHYFGLRGSFDRLAWRRARGVADDKTLIVHGTVNPAALAHEPQIVKSIVDAMRAGQFRCRPHLWIRLHPQCVRGPFSTSLAPYRELASPDVTVEEPPVRSEKLAWDLPREDATHLAQLLAAADVVTTTSSTLVIDAACAGTPIVTVLFDGPAPIEASLSVKRFALYTHYAKILATGGMPIAETLAQFVQAVDRYAGNPQLDAAEREAIIRQQLGMLDGQAGLRTAHVLLKLANRLPLAEHDRSLSLPSVLSDAVN